MHSNKKNKHNPLVLENRRKFGKFGAEFGAETDDSLL